MQQQKTETDRGRQAMTGYPSIDKPWLKYYSQEAQAAVPPAGTLYEQLWQNNQNHVGDTALIYYGKKITYGELFDRIEQTRNALLQRGIKKDDKVILYSLATPESVYVIYALCRIGAVADMINPLFDERQIIERINETDAQVVILLDQFIEKADFILEKTCVKSVVVVPFGNSMPKWKRAAAHKKIAKKINYTNMIISWADFLKDGAQKERISDAPYDKDQTWIIVYSSGTTGASKGIMLTNEGIGATVLHYGQVFSYKRNDKLFNPGPIWFSTFIVILLIMPLSLGISVILEPLFSPQTFVENIKKYKPNIALGATSLWLYAMQKLKSFDFSNLYYPGSGGEQILQRTEEAINRFLAEHGGRSALLKGWGMCELGGMVSTETSVCRKSGSVGIPLLHATVSAFDPESNKEKKYGERGELRVLSPARMKGYFKNENATKDFFREDAQGNCWGATGDIGYIDKDGFVYVLGRKEDMFICNGRRVYGFDVEHVILQNEYVNQCKAVCLTDAQGLSRIIVHLVLEENAIERKAEVIKAIHMLCRDSLEADCVPCGYRIWDTFPVKSSGKRDVEQLKSCRTDFCLPDGDELREVLFE